MANKKDFSNTLNPIESLLGATQEETAQEETKTNKPDAQKEAYTKQEKKEAFKKLEALKTTEEDLKAFSLKANKELMEQIKALAMLQKISIKDLFIQALINYCKDNEQDYLRALEFLNNYMK